MKPKMLKIICLHLAHPKLAGSFPKLAYEHLKTHRFHTFWQQFVLSLLISGCPTVTYIWKWFMAVVALVVTPSCPWKIRILAAVVSFSAWNSAGISQQPWRRHLFNGSCGRGQNFYGTRHEQFGSVSKPCTPVVHIKIAGKWMFIPLKMVLIGIDPYPFCGSITTKWDGTNWIQTRHGSRVENRTIYRRSRPGSGSLLRAWSGPNLPGLLVMVGDPNVDSLDPNVSMFDGCNPPLGCLTLPFCWLKAPWGWQEVSRFMLNIVCGCLWLHSIFSFWQIGKHPDVSCLNSPSWLVQSTCIYYIYTFFSIYHIVIWGYW